MATFKDREVFEFCEKTFEELKRQIKTSLYERLLLSKGDINKQEVLDLSLKGIEINEPKDIIKDPYVFEFLGIPELKSDTIKMKN